ncbi:hypothetical protein MNBD_GAMMA01-1331 [hydrothermal vent metagenome]|uniref:Uncharacterized protein n=1 Tax=hydrothermal vent metagenome TaxID=652676 RepID=A0A3B0VF80_9ZZZZ
MSTGTKIIQNALAKIGAHSVMSQAPPEAIDIGMDTLNSMISNWIVEGIDIGAVPLKAAGDELSEPLSLFNTVGDNLAIELQQYFPNAQISPELRASAVKKYNDMLIKYQAIVIPNAQVRGTLPKGQGNRNRWGTNQTFFNEGEELGS